MSLEIKGRIHQINATQQVSEKFSKREVIIEYADNPSFPEQVKFELQQDKCPLADKFKIGDEVEIAFNLKGRPYTNKDGVTTYFNNMVIWKINAASGGNSTPAYAAPVSMSAGIDEDDSGLPF